MGYDLSLWAYGGRATRICNSFSELDYVSGKIEIGGYDQLVEQSDNKHSWSSWRHAERRVPV